MESISTAMTFWIGAAGDVITAILANPVLTALFAVGFIGIAVGLVKKLKRV